MIGKKKKKSKSTLRRRSEQREINSNDRLVEFSDEENSFYIDEIKERELEEQAQRAREMMAMRIRSQRRRLTEQEIENFYY